MISTRGFALFCSLAFVTGPALAGPEAFTPDYHFDDSDLAEWSPIDDSSWAVVDGEIQTTQTGWLISSRKLQDAGFFARFRCELICATGVMLRTTKTAEGWEGIYVSLRDGEIGSYRLNLNEQGVETSRQLLYPIRGQVRQAPPPPDQPASATTDAVLKVGEWNTIQIIIDADIVRPVLNGIALPASATLDNSSGFGSIAIQGHPGTQFRDVSLADLSQRSWPAEAVSANFQMQRINDMHYSWSATVADFNKDGTNDIVTGPFVYYGPDFTHSREIYLGSTVNPSTQYPEESMMQWAYDFTGDGWVDVLTVGAIRTPARLLVNPQGESRRWDSFDVVPSVRKEIAVLADIDNDGEPEFVYTGDNTLRYAEPDLTDPTAPWIVHDISPEGAVGAGHGIGVGDINGNGKMDVVEASTWWEQPDDPGQEWIRHDYFFGNGSEMGIYDVNGDGLNDVVTALEAHGFGLVWHEQTRGTDGTVGFVMHTIMEGPNGENAGDVVFSQPHATAFADFNGDGLLDFLVGKRFWSHLDTYNDPDPHGAPVLYLYRATRNPDAPGGAEFVPELIHNRSGGGNTVLATDINGNGHLDILTATNRGTFVFWGAGEK